jgi:chloramphenicol 3-O-phosphotransferase
MHAEQVLSLLLPVARADSIVEWIGVNGERVDAVVTAGESQWRIVFGCSTGTTIDWLDVFERPIRFDGVAGGRAILINGPSGAGKSTLMRAIQQIATAPLVIFDEPEHIGSVQPQYLIWRDRAPALHFGYLDAIAALARAGNHVALPGAGHRQNEFVDAFGDVPIRSVGLTCDQDVLVERERRSGRWAGIAAESIGIHDGWIYDIEFDTTNAPDPLEHARQVLDSL